METLKIEIPEMPDQFELFEGMGEMSEEVTIQERDPATDRYNIRPAGWWPQRFEPFALTEPRRKWMNTMGGSNSYDRVAWKPGDYHRRGSSPVFNMTRFRNPNTTYTNEIVYAQPGSPRGHIVFGPYCRIGNGRYSAYFLLYVDKWQNNRDIIGTIDVVINKGKTEPLASAELTPHYVQNKPADKNGYNGKGRWAYYRLDFGSVPQGRTDVEMRVHYEGKGGVLAFAAAHLFRHP